MSKNNSENLSESLLPIKEIPGSYGIPFLTAIIDRIDYFYYHDDVDHVVSFFKARMDKYNSTVFRCNVPPSSFVASDPRVIVVCDAKAFQILFDNDKVEKKNVATGTYMSSTSFKGGYRPLLYQDPLEPNHPKLKSLMLSLLASRHNDFIPSFRTAYSSLFNSVESQFTFNPSARVVFNEINMATAFDFVNLSLFGSAPSAILGPDAYKMALKYMTVQVLPVITIGLPAILEELTFHTFPLPYFLVSSVYKSLLSYFTQAAKSFLDEAERQGISRDEALHNVAFVSIANFFGGTKLYFPCLMRRVAEAGPELHRRLREEIRSVVEEDGGKVTLLGLEKMVLTTSTVYEALRIDPPVDSQFGRAKEDMIVESHDFSFKVKKGELIYGFNPIASRGEKVFKNGWEFVPDRFVSEDGKKLLKYVMWSNGPQNGTSTNDNKQCVGKDWVPLMGRMLLVELFLRFDTFTAEIGKTEIEPKVTLTSVVKAATRPV